MPGIGGLDAHAHPHTIGPITIYIFRYKVLFKGIRTHILVDDELSKDVNQLADNIEGVIRQNMTLSGTAKWCNTPDTTFTGAFENNGIFVKGVLVNLQAKYFFK